MRKLIILSSLLALTVNSPATAQDVIIIGDTPEKQAETQQRWGRLNQPTQQETQAVGIQEDNVIINSLLSNWGETLIFRRLKQRKFVEFS